MDQLANNNTTPPGRNNPIHKIIKIGIIFIFTLLFIIIIFNPIFLIKHIGNVWGINISESINANKYLIGALELAIGFATYYIYSNIISFSSRRRQNAIMVFVMGGIVFFLGMYAITRNYSSNQCCALNLEDKYEFTNCDWTTHPEYGTPVVKCTREMLRMIRGVRPTDSKPIAISTTTRFFSQDGQPLLWFYESENGDITFFSHSGSHPQFGTPLKPVTPEIARKAMADIKGGKPSSHQGTSQGEPVTPKLLNHVSVNSEGSKEMAFCIVNASNVIDRKFTEDIASKFSAKYRTVTNLIPATSLNHPVIQSILNGNLDAMQKVDLIAFVDFICIGNYSMGSQTNSVAKDMFTATLSLEYTIYDVRNGKSIASFNKSVAGTGWSSKEAEKNAVSKIMGML